MRSRLSSYSQSSASVTQPKVFFSRVFSCDSIRSTSSARARVLESGDGMRDSLKKSSKGSASVHTHYSLGGGQGSHLLADALGGPIDEGQAFTRTIRAMAMFQQLYKK